MQTSSPKALKMICRKVEIFFEFIISDDIASVWMYLIVCIENASGHLTLLIQKGTRAPVPPVTDRGRYIHFAIHVFISIILCHREIIFLCLYL